MLQRRVFLLYSCLLSSVQGHADDVAATWSCEKTGGDKEWSCVTQAKPAKKSSSGEAPSEAAANNKSQAVVKSESEPVKTAQAPLQAELKPIVTKPPVVAHKSDGWTCNANSDEDTWDCNLVGSDPKGQATLIGEEQHHFGLLSPAFDLEQEQSFTHLKNALPNDPWQYCTAPWAERAASPAESDLGEQEPLNIRADYGENYEQEVSAFLGNVDITRGDQHLQAEKANYDSFSNVMDAQGHVLYSDAEVALFSRSAQVQLGTDKARLRDALFIEPSVPLRGTARSVYRDSKNFSRYDDVAYTSCRPGNQDWVMHGSQLKMNRDTGKGAIKNAWLEFKGLPVMYVPYLSFPVDNRRLTGFLSPSWGNTKKNGFDLNVPFYWNIAPNYDATLWARYLAKRGSLFGGKFRYLTPITKGQVTAEVVPHDSEESRTRWAGSLINNTSFNEHWSSMTELNQVSDDKYLGDLNSPLGINTSSYNHSYSNLTYNAADFSSLGLGVSSVALWDYWQNIDPAISDIYSPYQRLPQILLKLNKPLTFMPGLLAGMTSEYAYFHHSSRFDTGSRINLQPYITYPIETAGAFVKPKLALQQTEYVLNNRAAGLPGGISRTVPIASVDSGLVFERGIGSGDSTYVHTVEPRLFYVYIPYTNQDDIPIYDTALWDTNFISLFQENRFTGSDRVGDANQVTAALTSRLLQGGSGRELLSLSVGEIFYFQDRKVSQPTLDVTTGILTPGPTQTDNFSNIVTQLKGQLTDSVSFDTGLQWSSNDGNIDRGNAAIRYRDETNTIFNASYRYRRDAVDPTTELIHLADFSFRLPILDDWNAIARWQYSILDNLTLESFAGLEKESCCWRFRVLGRRYLNGVDTAPQNAVFVQVELKGLGSFGQDLDDFMEKSIYGYRKPNQ
jgi:LPS-assembly protein